MSQSDIDYLLDTWNETKKQIADLEKQLEKCKKAAERLMRKTGENELVSNHHVLTKKTMSRRTISKNDMPEQLWYKYSKECSYPAYYLTKNK